MFRFLRSVWRTAWYAAAREALAAHKAAVEKSLAEPSAANFDALIEASKFVRMYGGRQGRFGRIWGGPRPCGGPARRTALPFGGRA